MENINMTMGIFSVVLSAATLIAMVLGIKLGKKAMFKTETLFGKEAEDRFNSIKSRLPDSRLYFDGKYEGGSKATPQFELERFYYDPQTMGKEWKNISKTIRYYSKNNQGEIMVKAWRL